MHDAFDVAYSLQSAGESDLAGTASELAIHQSRKHDVANETVLIVDSDMGSARSMALIALDCGLGVRVCGDPVHALDAYRQAPADILVVEMIMPGKDGIDVIHEILAAGHAPRIIGLSALSQSYLQLADRVARFHGLDGIATLQKPFTRARFEALLLSLTTAA